MFKRHNVKTEGLSKVLSLIFGISWVSLDFALLSLSHSLRTLESTFMCLALICPRM